MLTSIDEFLRYFGGVHRRALRDVAALPPQADGWRPSQGEGEKAWTINGIVGHMATARLYFASAYRGEGWVSPAPADVSTRERWLPVLEESAAQLWSLLAETPDAWLRRKVEMIDSSRRDVGLARAAADDGARHPSPQPDRHLRRHQRLGPARHLRSRRGDDRGVARAAASEVPVTEPPMA